MTDVELLPLPSVLLNWPNPTNHVAIRDYARANVAHATAAKDAEIADLMECNRSLMDALNVAELSNESLRAEVERLEEESQSRLEACGDAVSKLCAAEARAERRAEALQRALEAVRDTLQQSYQNAGQECCGRGGMQECCGEPEPVWAPEDQAVMDKLAPIERMLSSALRDHGKEGKDG